MAHVKNMANRFMQDESGQNLIEYGLIACLIGLAAVVAMTNVGTSIKTAFNKVSSSLNSAI